MAVQNLSGGDDEAEYLSTLRDDEFMNAIEAHVSNVQFNPRTGHIIAHFRNDDDERARASSEVYQLARTHAYEVVRTSANKFGMTVVFG